eukprot:300698-Chlamydomonas_euryale.AAC.2
MRLFGTCMRRAGCAKFNHSNSIISKTNVRAAQGVHSTTTATASALRQMYAPLRVCIAKHNNSNGIISKTNVRAAQGVYSTTTATASSLRQMDAPLRVCKAQQQQQQRLVPLVGEVHAAGAEQRAQQGVAAAVDQQ